MKLLLTVASLVACYLIALEVVERYFPPVDDLVGTESSVQNYVTTEMDYSTGNSLWVTVKIVTKPGYKPKATKFTFNPAPTLTVQNTLDVISAVFPKDTKKITYRASGALCEGPEYTKCSEEIFNVDGLLAH